MTWGLWLSLLGATVSASAMAVSWYFNWSFRYRIGWLGTVTEVSLAALIVFLAAAASADLLGHMPQ